MSKETSKPAKPDVITDEDEDTAPEWPKAVEWEGMTFHVPNPENWTLGTLRAFETGKQIDAMARVLGADWSQIEDMPVSATLSLFEIIAHVAGFASAGE